MPSVESEDGEEHPPTLTKEQIKYIHSNLLYGSSITILEWFGGE